MYSGIATMLFRIAVVCVSLLVPHLLSAQSTGSVHGTVRDSISHTPLKAATAVLIDAKDSTAQLLGAKTDDKGAFTITNVPIGRSYTLELRFVGYEKKRVALSALTSEGQQLEAGEISLSEQSVNGTGVTVTAQKELVTVKPDKTVYGIQNNPAYTATNVSELLGQLPSVQVDQDGKITLRGSDVTIMVNDKPLNMPADQRDKFLQSLPASTVKDIEIRTNPGAKFDATQQGGIINIITKRTLGDMIGAYVNSGANTTGQINGGLGGYFNGDALNASLGGGGNYGPNKNSATALRYNYLDSSEHRIESISSGESISNSWYGYGQLDYKITSSDIASLSFNMNKWPSNYASSGTIVYRNTAGDVVRNTYDTNYRIPTSKNSGGYGTASLLLKHTFAEDHTISANISYNTYWYSSTTVYRSSSYLPGNLLDTARSYDRRTLYDQRNETLITSIDYENPLTDKLKLELGGKNERNMLDNNVVIDNLDMSRGEYAPDSALTNHYLPQNSIYALYGSLMWKISDALSVQGGFRAEHANISAKYASGVELISRDFTNVFPSGSVTYTINENNTLTLNYRRSVSLPDVDGLNPTRYRTGSLSEYSGNPNLDPEFTNTVQLAYNTFWGTGNSVSITPYFSLSTGDIESTVQFINGITYNSNANFNGTTSVGTEVSIAIRPVTGINLRLSGYAFRKENRGSSIPGDIYTSSYEFRSNGFMTIDIMKGLVFGLNFSYSGPKVTGQNERLARGNLNMSLRQNLLDNKLSIALRVNDPFNIQNWSNVYRSDEFYSESVSKWGSRNVGINISYNFGTTPQMENHKQDKSDTKGSSGGGTGGGS